jgi:hypothetical protein
MPSNFSYFLIPAILLNLSIFLLIAVVTLWISSLLLTRHCVLSSLTIRFHLLIVFLFSMNSVYNHHVLLLSSISHSDALMPFTFLILFVTFFLLLSSTILDPSLSELVDCYNFTLSSLLNNCAPLETKAIHSRPSQPWFTSQLHALKISCRQLQRICMGSYSFCL